MGTLYALQAESAAPVRRRRKGSLDQLWDRVQARARRAQTQAAEERERAKALLDELMRLPNAEERLETVEREPRFWTLGVVEHLLATAQPAAPASALHLAELALALVRRLTPQDYDESLLAEQEVVAWSVQAEAHRRHGDFARAERAFRAAARRLASEPLDVPERAVFSRYLARLRLDQGWDDEALGLLQRAVDLCEQGEGPAVAGEILAERGWLSLDAGDPAAAQPVLAQAAILLQRAPRPEALIRTRLGLALADAELGMTEEARQALAAAQALYRKAPWSEASLPYLILEARIAERLGEGARAVVWLRSALFGLLAQGMFYDAAMAALDLVQIYAAQGRAANLVEIERLWAAVAPLCEPGALPERARSVLFFALHLASRRDRAAAERLEQAAEFLERARERPWLRFEVARHPRTELFWDLLDLGMRRDLCAKAGLPAEAAALPAAELGATERDLITWGYELLHQVRIVFDPPASTP
jgi:tetratricopeptide (TPR) repeat protein